MAREEPKVYIRLPQELKDKLHALAAKNKRSVNAEMVAAIEAAVEEHEHSSDASSVQYGEILKRLERLEERLAGK